jgi:hypothetical protein
MLKRAIILISIAATLLGTHGRHYTLAAPDGHKNQPPPLPGWTHTQTFQDDTPQKHGIVLSGADIVRGSPTIAEIDNNPSNGKEVVVGGGDGMLYAYRANGSLLWSLNVMPGTCSPGANDFKVHSAPAVGAIYGDGVPYVLVTYGTILPSNCDGGLVVYRGPDGALAWRFSLRAWQASQGYPPEALYGAVSSPAVADTDGDGKMEIGFGGFDRYVYLLNASGGVRWYYHAADTAWSSPAFYDVNGDGRLDLIIGTDISANAPSGTSDGGYVYAFDSAPRTPARIEFCAPAFPASCAPNAFIWRAFFDQAVYSSVVVADVLSSNPGAEIIIGSGCYFPSDSSNKRGRWVKILRLSDGATLQTLNAPACVQSSPAVGDLDDDGALEIVATVNGATSVGGDGSSRVAAWKPINPTPIWSVIPHDPNSGNNDPFGGDLQSPVIADLDGNGSLEVAAGNFWSVHVLNGRTGAFLTCQGASCGAQTSLFTWKTVKSTPAIGDINNDGRLDLVIASGNALNPSARGQFYAWTGFDVSNINSPSGSQQPYAAPWPMFRGNPQNTGVYGIGSAASALTLNATPNAVTALLPVSQAATYKISVRRSDNAVANWSAVESDANDIVSLDPDSGSTSEPLILVVKAPNAVGEYRATVQVNSDDAKSASISITVKVVRQVQFAFVPYVRR